MFPGEEPNVRIVVALLVGTTPPVQFDVVDQLVLTPVKLVQVWEYDWLAKSEEKTEKSRKARVNCRIMTESPHKVSGNRTLFS
jgi:hypothetical protein